MTEIVLVGGFTCISRIQKLSSYFFDGKKLGMSIKPDEAAGTFFASLMPTPVYMGGVASSTWASDVYEDSQTIRQDVRTDAGKVQISPSYENNDTV